jgi:hypothetical protein
MTLFRSSCRGDRVARFVIGKVFLWHILTCEGIKAETSIVEVASSIWQEEKLNVDA